MDVLSVSTMALSKVIAT